MRYLAIPQHVHQGFLDCITKLPPETLTTIARYLWGDQVAFDPAIDKLRSTNKAEATSFAPPPPFVPTPQSFSRGAQPPPQPINQADQVRAEGGPPRLGRVGMGVYS